MDESRSSGEAGEAGEATIQRLASQMRCRQAGQFLVAMLGSLGAWGR
jgi:hypothetical protein